MEHDFWQERWALGQIGFHLQEVNPYLQRHWPGLQLQTASRVLVPLCGKSLDLLWLMAQGHAVLGVKLAEKAVEDFFSEQGMVAELEVRGAFRIHRAGDLELWCGDFFALTAADVADCQALYDRAALIALPCELRERYVQHLAQILSPGCRGLLVTLDYPQEQMDGPPFAVAADEVRRLLEPDWQVQALETADVLGENWRFLKRGLTRLDEAVYRLRKRQ